MKSKKVYLTIAVNVDLENGVTVDDFVQEMEYTIGSIPGSAVVTSTEITDYEECDFY